MAYKLLAKLKPFTSQRIFNLQPAWTLNVRTLKYMHDYCVHVLWDCYSTTVNSWFTMTALHSHMMYVLSIDNKWNTSFDFSTDVSFVRSLRQKWGLTNLCEPIYWYLMLKLGCKPTHHKEHFYITIETD